MTSPKEIQQAANIVLNNGVISYPTESVFGLGCNPSSEAAVTRILQLKQRSIDKGLIIVGASLSQLSAYSNLTEKDQQSILQEPLATTWLVRKSETTPHWVCGQHEKVAIRLSRHPVVVGVCNAMNQAIISTSANPAGAEPALNSQQSRCYFSDQIDFYLDDENEGNANGQPTPIIDIETGQRFR